MLDREVDKYAPNFCLSTLLDEYLTIGQLLFNIWEIPERITTERLITEINDRFSIASTCVGQNAVEFVPHWHLEREVLSSPTLD